VGIGIAWHNEPDPDDPTVDLPDEVCQAVDCNPLPECICTDDEKYQNNVAAEALEKSYEIVTVIDAFGDMGLRLAYGAPPELPPLDLSLVA
jgi:hypothetical protein